MTDENYEPIDQQGAVPAGIEVENEPYQETIQPIFGQPIYQPPVYQQPIIPQQSVMGQQPIMPQQSVVGQ